MLYACKGISHLRVLIQFAFCLFELMDLVFKLLGDAMLNEFLPAGIKSHGLHLISESEGGLFHICNFNSRIEMRYVVLTQMAQSIHQPIHIATIRGKLIPSELNLLNVNRMFHITDK